VRVDAPVGLIEALKFLSVSGAPKGKRVAAFTCSGGDATMVADYCQKVGLELTQPSKQAHEKLSALLPDIATVSNPLDYTVPLWGNTEIMPQVFGALMADGYDAALIVQDFPPPHIHQDNTLYRNDANSFMRASNLLGIPAAVCSDLPENIDRESREMMIAGGVTPLQGLDSGLEALALAADYGVKQDRLAQSPDPIEFTTIKVPAGYSNTRTIDEWEGKKRLKTAGIDIPEAVLCEPSRVAVEADNLGYPLVVKAVSEGLPHKSEAGAVKVNMRDSADVVRAVFEIQASVLAVQPDLKVEYFLLESMIDNVLAELLVGINTDPQFGQTLVIASGGVWVELLKDSTTLLLPTNRQRVLEAIQSLRSFALLQGFRGKPECDLDLLVDTIYSIAGFAAHNGDRLIEMDINPLMVTEDRVVAADVMIRETMD
jgi:acyl-CoA synthetase (NDP forming)